MLRRSEDTGLPYEVAKWCTISRKTRRQMRAARFGGGREVGEMGEVIEVGDAEDAGVVGIQQR